jgi:adenylate kinase family enzyme
MRASRLPESCASFKLRSVMRILIAGVPRSGKTTLANQLERSARHTDDLIGARDWSAASAEVATWFDAPGPWVIEGVAVPRALRKWFASHATGAPADEIRWLGYPRLTLTSGQAAMAKACETVWREVLPELRRRGVTVS